MNPMRETTNIKKRLLYLLDDALSVYRFNAWGNSDRIANHLIAHGVTMESEWINVKDRLPKNDGKDVLTYRGVDGVCIELYANGYGFSFDDMFKSEVTHWMPLPEPPKGD